MFYIDLFTQSEKSSSVGSVWRKHMEDIFSAKFVTPYFSSDELSDLLTAGQWRSQNYFWMVVWSLIQFENKVVEWHYYST